MQFVSGQILIWFVYRGGLPSVRPSTTPYRTNKRLSISSGKSPPVIQRSKTALEPSANSLTRSMPNMGERPISNISEARQSPNGSESNGKTKELSSPSILKIGENRELHRSLSDMGSCNKEEDTIEKKRRPRTSVRFEEPSNNVKKTRNRVTDGAQLVGSESSLLFRRSRRKSVFAFTKAKQYELRNEGFKEDMVIYQEELGDKLQDFYGRLEVYKEEYRKSLEPKVQELPPVKDKDITSTDDVTEDKYSSEYFMKKLRNPFASRLNKRPMSPPPVTDTENDLPSQSAIVQETEVHLSSKSPVEAKEEVTTVDVKSVIPQASANIFNAPKPPPISNSPTGHTETELSQTPKSTPHHFDRQTIRRTLSIASRPPESKKRTNSEELSRQRLKLLYLDAHGSLEVPEEKPKDNGVAKTELSHSRKGELQLDRTAIREAFDEFIGGQKTHDDMMKMVSMVAKMKHNLRKKRDKSFIPFFAARKVAQAWRLRASKRREERMENAAQNVVSAAN